MRELIDVFNARSDQLLWALIEHIQLSFISLLIAAVIAIPLGIWLTKTKRLAEAVINITAVLQTIPSLAILGLMIPLFGIGKVPAVIALVIYALLPILRNTYTGIKNVDSSLLEAADGIGMKPMRRLFKVELPLAMSVIMAGVRTAMVLIVGTATLVALIGAGGLGDLILLGIDRNNTELILLGAIPAAILAISLDLVLRVIQNLSYKRIVLTLGAILLVMLLVSVIPLISNRDSDISIAGKLGTEPSIITNMYKILIEEETDFTVRVRDGLGSTSFVFNALESGEIDGYLEFTGTVLMDIVDSPPEEYDAEAVFEQARDAISEMYDFALLEPMQYNNTYGIAVTREFAEENNLESISDLGSIESQIVAGFTAEFNDREDGYPAIQETYNLSFSEVYTMEQQMRFTAIVAGDINLMEAWATDAALVEYDLVVLEDDRDVFPPYQGAPLFKQEFIDTYPEVGDALNKLAGLITDEEMQEMNYRVQFEDEDPYDVAYDFLSGAGLVD